MGEVHYLFYVVLIGVCGSVTSFINHNNKGCKALFKRILDGVFSAYIVYEMSYHFFQDERFSYAFCGVGAWFGSEILVFVRDIVVTRFGGNNSSKGY